MAIKKFKPTTPGRRQMSIVDYSVLTKKKPEKSLTKRLQKHSGRNNTGRITCRHRGGGTTRQYRTIDFKHVDKLNIPARVTAVEYDPNRTSYIILVQYTDGEKRYHLAPEGVKVGDEIIAAKRAKIKPGNRMMLSSIPVGFDVFNIQIDPKRSGQMVRSAGSSAKVVSLEGEFAQVQLPSKEIRLFHKDCYATIGRVSNSEHSLVTIGKAGRTRNMGRRPQVRGKVMNPVDHPHGGGEGVNPIGLIYPKTPWGMPAIGYKTRNKRKASRMIFRTRKGKLNVKTTEPTN
jgi:large subunit ribosomal protein L2